LARWQAKTENTNQWLVERILFSDFMGSCEKIFAPNLPRFGGDRPRQADESPLEPGETGGKGRIYAQLHWRY
jgi:hypothetical protein